LHIFGISHNVTLGEIIAFGDIMVVSSKLVNSFAVNLRWYCNQKSSIAQICRETSIHRQQFNKYLSGSSFPNAHNLSKICKYLDVSAENLFATSTASDTVTRSENQTKSVVDTIGKQPNFDLANFDGGFYEVSNQIQVGSYFCYFPFPGYEGALLRTYMRIWKTEGRFQFSRLTRVCHAGDKRNVIARGRHNGNLLLSANEVTFIGRNKQVPHELSLINLERKSTFDGFHFGLAFIRAADSAMACRTSLEYLGSNALTRKMLSSLGIVHAGDESVPKQIRLALFEKDVSEQHTLFPPSSTDIFAYLLDQ
jgi:transcriptional regulator with XRE-family HTH domain